MEPVRRLTLLLATVLVMASALGGCTSDDPDDRVGVVVTIGPQKEMVSSLGGKLVRVTVMVPPGESPHSYAPVPSQMKEVARAKIYFKVGSGVEFELNHLDELKAQNGKLRFFDCSQGVTLRELDGDHDDHDHDDGSGLDPHIWLSPVNAITMVENIYSGLVKVDPDNEEVYSENKDAYMARLQEAHEGIMARFDGHENESFLIYHPSWGYFADEYGLVQLGIEEAGKEPGPAGIAAIVDQAKEAGIDVIYVDPSFDRTSGEAIAAELGGKVLTLDPLAEDYIDNMELSADRLLKGLSAGGG